MPRQTKPREALDSVIAADKRLGWAIAILESLNGPESGNFSGYTGQSVLRRLRAAKRETEQAITSCELLVESQKEPVAS